MPVNGKYKYFTYEVNLLKFNFKHRFGDIIALVRARYAPSVFNTSIPITNIVNGILSLQRNQALQLIGKTTRTGFRRIHEILTSFLDQAIPLLQLGDLRRIQLAISKSMILVRYQESRDQLSKGLAEELITLLSQLSSTLVSSKVPLQTKREIIERCRTFLDSLMVLVYIHKKR